MARLKSVKKKARAPGLIRQPVVAGIFYPESQRSLADAIDEVTHRKAQKESFVVLVAPHGGDPASVEVAGKLFSHLKPCRRALVLGPSHAQVGKPYALFPAGVWKTPVGKMSVDQPLAQALLETAPDLKLDVEAHEEEHAIEVILPFLLRICGIRFFVPLVFRLEEPLHEICVERARRLGFQIAQVLQSFKEPIPLVISTNLSQYEPSPVVESQDRRAIARMVALDEEGLIQDALEGKVSMCGLFPAAVGIVAGKKLGGSKGVLVCHQMSRQLNGQSRSAVGYAGIGIR